MLLRYPAVSVFIAALVIRLVAYVVAAVWFDDLFAGMDDGLYYRLAIEAADGSSQDWSAHFQSVYDRTAVFLIPLTAIVAAAGPSRFAATAFVIVLGAAAAAFTTKFAARLTDVRTGLFAGLGVALLPSQIAWSILVLKDPLVWVFEIGAIAAFVGVIVSERRRTMWAIGSALCIYGLAFTRDHSAIVVAWALVAGAVVLWFRMGWRPVVVATLLAIAVPWAAGLGPAGLDIVSGARAPSEQRQAFARGAESAIETPELDEPEKSRGESLPGEVSESPLDEITHLPRGYSVMFLEPYPWHPRNDARFLLAKIDTILWYPAVFLALVGAYHSLRRSTPAVLVVAAVAGLGTALALYEGNLGTAFRHRGELVWGVAVLAAVGWREIRNRKAAPT